MEETRIVKQKSAYPGYYYFILVGDRYMGWNSKKNVWYAPWEHDWINGAPRTRFLWKYGEDVSPLEFLVVHGMEYDAAIEMARKRLY
jgi:hypothetical protein